MTHCDGNLHYCDSSECEQHVREQVGAQAPRGKRGDEHVGVEEDLHDTSRCVLPLAESQGYLTDDDVFREHDLVVGEVVLTRGLVRTPSQCYSYLKE